MPGGAAPPHNMEFILIFAIGVLMAYFIGRNTASAEEYEYGYNDGYNDCRVDSWDDVDLVDIVADELGPRTLDHASRVANNVGPERRW